MIGVLEWLHKEEVGHKLHLLRYIYLSIFLQKLNSLT